MCLEFAIDGMTSLLIVERPIFGTTIHGTIGM